MTAVDLVNDYVTALECETRRLEAAQWGLTLPPDRAAGWPLDIGVRIAAGLLTVRTFAAPATSAPEPQVLLAWNRHSRLVRFGCTRQGDVWVHGDLPADRVCERDLDRLLGLIVEGAMAVREYAAGVPSAGRAGHDARGTGWGAVPSA